MQTLRVYNSRIPMINNAKFSGYYFYMNMNIYGDFRICIRVPLNIRSSHQRRSIKEGVLRNFLKFTGKHLAQVFSCEFCEISKNSLFFNKVAGLGPTTLSKKRPWHRRFPVNFADTLTGHLWTTASYTFWVSSWLTSKINYNKFII